MLPGDSEPCFKGLEVREEDQGTCPPSTAKHNKTNESNITQFFVIINKSITVLANAIAYESPITASPSTNAGTNFIGLNFTNSAKEDQPSESPSKKELFHTIKSI